MQKTADQSNKHTRETISVTYICIQLPTSNLGNDLVTELLLKSALSCLLQIEQFYATCLISTSLPISLHIFRYFFIFLDQLPKTTARFAQNNGSFCTKQRLVCCILYERHNTATVEKTIVKSSIIPPLACTRTRT